MRKILFSGLLVALVLSLAACGGTAPSSGAADDSPLPPSPGSESSSEPEDSESLPPVIEPLLEPESEAPSVSLDEGESMITGLITYSDGSMLMIVTSDFKSYMFNVAGDGVDTSGARGMVEGSEADVCFTGELRENDPSGMPATRVLQSESQSAPSSNVKAIIGQIIACDDAALSIDTPGGDNLSFIISGETVDKSGAENLAAGEYVTVFYTGDPGESAQVIRLVQ